MPPFFIPIAAFLAWFFALYFYFPVFKLNLYLSDQFLASGFLASCLILVLAWALSGPMIAAVLTFLSIATALYLALIAKEPVLFWQTVIYGGLFVFMVFYLYQIQKSNNQKQIIREKILEEIRFKKTKTKEQEALKEAFEKKMSRFSDLRIFSERIKDLHTTQAVAERIVYHVMHTLSRAREASLYLVDKNAYRLELIASTVGLPPDHLAGGEALADEGSVFDKWVLKKAQGLKIDDTHNDFRFAAQGDPSSARWRSICASPLLTENKVMGVLRIRAEDPAVFTADDLRFLDIISSLAAVTIRNMLLYERMEELAARDSLTGVYLNRYFQERLKEEIERSKAHQETFSVILLDIDFFKIYNDTYGHTAGDAVLKHVVQIISSCLGPQDSLARYGGEEFIVLLPRVDKEKALEVAERIREKIERGQLLIRRMEGPVTASLGVVNFPSEADTPEEIMRVVDQNLYSAKKTGRNRVCGNICS